MDIWSWSLRTYGRPGVAEACLRLQDAHGQNVPLLLWAAWAGARDPEFVGRAAEVARAWDAKAISPLRAVRRALKAVHPPVADADREGLREEVKAVELRAERVLLETLAALGPCAEKAPALEALAAAAGAWSPENPPPREALAVLAAALE